MSYSSDAVIGGIGVSGEEIQQSSLTIKQDNFISQLRMAEKAILSGKVTEGLDYLRAVMSQGAMKGALTDEEVQNEDKWPDILLQNDAIDGVLTRGRFPLNIFTFGRFAVLKKGKPICISGKAHQKPLELLKLLIAEGGRNVCKCHLCELLWPDAEGDMASQSFDTTLYRLRKIIGKGAVILKESRVTINQDYCWVDCWAFERLLNYTMSLGLNNESVIPLIDAVLTIYQGEFIVGEDAGWLISRRERLRSKLMRLINWYGRYLIRTEQYENAVLLYSKALEVDDLLEEFHIGLIKSQKMLGFYSEAIIAYQRCYKTMTSVLSVEPSSQCQELYRSISYV